MPTIQDYASLGKAITDFSHRQDIASYQDYFIQGAQEALLNDLFDLNFGNGVQWMEESISGVISAAGTFPVPSDWYSPKFMTVSDGQSDQFTLIFKTPAWIYDQYPIRQPEGLPAYIARDSSGGSNVFVFGPFPDSAYSLQGTYYSQTPLLSQAAPVNWMVTYAPTCLHAACMIQVADFLIDDAMTQRWTPIYQARLKALVDADKAERYSAATMQIELA